MRIEILEKLQDFLHSHFPIDEECEAVYLMVELRKLLDRLNEEGFIGSFPLIRFYADWTVHTSKDRITPQIREIMTRVDENLTPYPNDGDIRFLSMPHLRDEMLALFGQYGLPLMMFEEEYWISFVVKLSHVLGDQPILNPTRRITEFKYINVGDGRIMATIEFNDNRGSITLGSATD